MHLGVVLFLPPSRRLGMERAWPDAAGGLSDGCAICLAGRRDRGVAGDAAGYFPLRRSRPLFCRLPGAQRDRPCGHVVRRRSPGLRILCLDTGGLDRVVRVGAVPDQIRRPVREPGGVRRANPVPDDSDLSTDLPLCPSFILRITTSAGPAQWLERGLAG